MAATDPVTTKLPDAEAILDDASADDRAAGVGPGKLALRRLRRNKVALAFGLLFLLLVGSALCAPIWANQVADTGPNKTHLTDRITIDGEETDVVALDGVPIGPQWMKADGKYFLGADGSGRDVMVRLLYGARNSLFIGITASIITVLLAVSLGVLAGYYRKWVDAVISRGLDVLWAFPVLLLGIALGVSLALGGLKIGPIEVRGNSLWIPTLIIGFVSIVYLARPIRGQVLSLREKEFIEAARAQGASDWKIMFSELLPNLASTILVFVPILMANAILLEAALSFLGVGVQPPTPTWGAMIADAIAVFDSAWWYMTFPGLALLLTVLAFNLVGDGLQDALSPQSSSR